MCQPFFRQAQTEAHYTQPSPQKRYDPRAKKMRMQGRFYNLGEPEFHPDQNFDNVQWIHWYVFQPATGRRWNFKISFWLEDEIFWNKPRPTEKELLKMARREIFKHLAPIRSLEPSDAEVTIILGDEWAVRGLKEQGPLPSRRYRR